METGLKCTHEFCKYLVLLDINQIMHLDCLMHFADAGRTVEAPAGAAVPAAKCSDAPSMRILGDVASQPPLCLPRLSLSLPLSLSLSSTLAAAGPRCIQLRVASPSATACSRRLLHPADGVATRRPTPPARSGRAKRGSLAASKIPVRARWSKGKGASE
jgi:hypothetical protein